MRAQVRASLSSPTAALPRRRQANNTLPAPLAMGPPRRRGKHLQKHYTVYLSELGGAARQNYAPQLNHEHTDARWFAAREVLLPGAPAVVELHPVLRAMREQHEGAMRLLVEDGLAAAVAAAPGRA